MDQRIDGRADVGDIHMFIGMMAKSILAANEEHRDGGYARENDAVVSSPADEVGDGLLPLCHRLRGLPEQTR